MLNTIQVLLSFMITAFIAVIVSSSLIVQEQFFKNARPSLMRRRLLNSYSDQQIMTGIAVQVVGLLKMDSMVPYHFFIVWMLSMLSMAVHNMTLLALVQDFRRDWVLRWLRQFLMFVNMALSCTFGVIVLRVVDMGLTRSGLPVSCALGGTLPPGAKQNDVAISFIGTIAVIVANVVIFGFATWYLQSRRQRFYRIIQLVGQALMIASAVGVCARVITLASAFGGRPNIVLHDDAEGQWMFGSFVSLGLLLLPLIFLVEIYRGEVKVAPPLQDAVKLRG